MLPGGNGPQHLGHATFQVLLAHLWFQLPTAEVGRSLLDGLTVMIAPSNPSMPMPFVADAPDVELLLGIAAEAQTSVF